MGTTVNVDNLRSILNHSTANRELSFTCGPIFPASSLDVYASPALLATKIKFHDDVTKAMGMVKK